MRVDGTYTFSGSNARLLAALEDAETLARVVPGCERLLQLGPAGGDGTLAFEARVRTGGGIVTATVRALISRTPARLRLDLRGYGPATGAFEGTGTLDLVEREGHTVFAYALAVTGPLLALEGQAAPTVARRFMCACCDRLALELHAGAEAAADGRADERGEIVAVRTPRGRIIALRGAAGKPVPAFGANAWTERALWMGTGLLLGVSLISAGLSLLRRLEDRDE